MQIEGQIIRKRTVYHGTIFCPGIHLFWLIVVFPLCCTTKGNKLRNSYSTVEKTVGKPRTYIVYTGKLVSRYIIADAH